MLQLKNLFFLPHTIFSSTFIFLKFFMQVYSESKKSDMSNGQRFIESAKEVSNNIEEIGEYIYEYNRNNLLISFIFSITFWACIIRLIFY